jgi:hypothetical protein
MNVLKSLDHLLFGGYFTLETKVEIPVEIPDEIKEAVFDYFFDINRNSEIVRDKNDI